jgi:hypothetical protein
MDSSVITYYLSFSFWQWAYHKTPTSPCEKRILVIDSMASSVKNSFERNALLHDMTIGQKDMKVKGYARVCPGAL